MPLNFYAKIAGFSRRAKAIATEVRRKKIRLRCCCAFLATTIIGPGNKTIESLLCQTKIPSQ